MSRIRRLLEPRPGFPVVVAGAVYVALGLVYARSIGSLLPIDWFVVGLYELISLAVLYAGLRITDRRRAAAEGLQVLGATLGFGLIGGVVAAGLITHQLQRGVPIQDAWFLTTAASATTAAIGVGLALYYIDLQAERANIARQAATVSELNKRLTVLHRVLRHNLRNELTIIQGHLDLLIEKEPAPAVADSLRTLRYRSENIESLSENAYRLRQVWAEEALVELEVTELVENSVRELEAAHPELSIETDIPAHAVVRAHPRLKLAIDEALENAVVHNESTTVDVIVDVSRIRDDEPRVAISIADTGSGIPEFEPAVLELVEESPLEHATGLGLWLIYWVVEQSGGTLRFEANEPRGTIVHLTLPAVPD